MVPIIIALTVFLKSSRALDVAVAAGTAQPPAQVEAFSREPGAARKRRKSTTALPQKSQQQICAQLVSALITMSLMVNHCVNMATAVRSFGEDRAVKV